MSKHNTANKYVAIVTGASRGIGAEIAHRLALDGFAVVINYRNNTNKANKLVENIKLRGGQAIAVKADITNSKEVSHLFAEAEQHLGKVDVLINNAGVLTTKPLAEHSDELFDHTFAINTRGTFNTLRQAAKSMNDGGRIVNLSSSTIALKLPGYAIYSASKAAVESMSQIFAKELRGRDITVNVVAPGPVETELFFAGKSEQQISQLENMSPLGRLGQANDIASVVSFLVGKDGAWINGQVIRANGGIT
ncbi:MAG: 3-ketoacyl-ACP reductase [Gammaproteobacteria bacterium]|nr:MAG: 3-ketoacyl-ACP reductase [Gammaproteobacteria bacterium]